jgi:hypothetical protein
MACLCENVSFMDQANRTPSSVHHSEMTAAPRRRSDFGAFRLDAIALNPDLALGCDTGVPEPAAPESIGAWILADATCKAIVDQVTKDVLKLRLIGASCRINPSPYGVVTAMGFAYSEAPRNTLAYGMFLGRFVFRAIALTARCQRAYCVAAHSRRQRILNS